MFGVLYRQNLFGMMFIELLENKQTTLNIGNLWLEILCGVSNKNLVAEKLD